ncbi:MAG: tRNA lysidine(34) synthetase TilS, partial [Candidatus Neomarinimicrobiota bacterium]|nr:tRNA lysidine(34) synthetase TilS [Candidatus Neomarinimicrobiota bacterium]
ANLNNIKYVNDISNNDLTIKRNYVRKIIVNKLETIDRGVTDKFSLIANKAKTSVMRLNYAIKTLAKSIEKNSLGYFLLEDEKLKLISDFHKLTLVKELIGETNKPWRSHKYNSLTNFFHYSDTGSILRLSDNWTILRDRKKWILRQNKSIKVNINIKNHGKYNINDSIFSLKKIDKYNFNNNLSTEVIDYDKIKNKNLRIRSWLNGDWFQPLGMNGKKKVSDYLIDNKIDCFKKDNQLVFTAADEIIWLCGQRISDKVKVTNKTSNMMELSYNKFVL